MNDFSSDRIQDARGAASVSRLDQWLDHLALHASGDDKPAVLVSACLLGQPVRYDGDDKRHSTIADVLPRWLQLRGTCPETGIGLPVPRPPIDVIETSAGQRVYGLDGRTGDVTDALRAETDRLPANLSGVILKARSPSCGLGNTPLRLPDGKVIGSTDGAFAARVRERWPALPAVHEEQLASAADIEVFVLSVYLHRQRQRWRRDTWPAPLRDAVSALPGDTGARLRAWLAR